MLVVACPGALGDLICTEFSGAILGFPEAVEGEDSPESDLDDIRCILKSRQPGRNNPVYLTGLDHD